MNLKRIFVFLGFFGVAVTLVQAQSQSGGNRELTVEETYLQQSVETMIIREQSRAESRDLKLAALKYIGEAIDHGNKGAEIKDALEYMGIEGTINKTRENGRLMNNYPDIRVIAASYLGALGTNEAKDILIKICLADNEPMVLTEAIKSLGKIGLNDNDETAAVISLIIRRFDILHPDNLLALSALEAFEKLALANGRIDLHSVQMVMMIADGQYLLSVKERARHVLDVLRRANAQSRN
ncbi:MAG: HEAT repeat domain-containing protein [Treponema sp.]|jgi:plasmid stability protein|nr:HEAT repeat domain-containing protein [Treponema sp.]